MIAFITGLAVGFGLGRTKHLSRIFAAVKSAYAKVFHKA